MWLNLNVFLLPWCLKFSTSYFLLFPYGNWSVSECQWLYVASLLFSPLQCLRGGGGFFLETVCNCGATETEYLLPRCLQPCLCGWGSQTYARCTKCLSYWREQSRAELMCCTNLLRRHRSLIIPQWKSSLWEENQESLSFCICWLEVWLEASGLAKKKKDNSLTDWRHKSLVMWLRGAWKNTWKCEKHLWEVYLLLQPGAVWGNLVLLMGWDPQRLSIGGMMYSLVCTSG